MPLQYVAIFQGWKMIIFRLKSANLFWHMQKADFLMTRLIYSDLVSLKLVSSHLMYLNQVMSIMMFGINMDVLNIELFSLKSLECHALSRVMRKPAFCLCFRHIFPHPARNFKPLAIFCGCTARFGRKP